MDFEPTAEKLIPDLSPTEELVVLARALWREGYNDHLAGHITVALGDGTLLCNPWLITWDELRPSQVLRIDIDGGVVEGDWPVPLGIPLHLEMHKLRSDITWAVHNHPLFGTVWADMGEIPPAMDQSSALGGGGLALVNEYEGPVNDPASARRAVEQMGTACNALLAGHGVFVLGGSARAVHQRAVALEQRCQRAWHVRAAGSTAPSPLPQTFLNVMAASDGEGFIGFWEAAVRAVLRADPHLLD
jgi:L-ribulose-5-phosphate 4-epimerase